MTRILLTYILPLVLPALVWYLWHQFRPQRPGEEKKKGWRAAPVPDRQAMKLRDVNTTDIGGAIRAGCRTMASVFNADDNDVPFFGSQVWPDPHLAFSSVHSESHVPGRHLNALLTAESLGFAIDEAAVEKHAHAAFFSYGGPLPLPLNRERMDGPLENFRPHNVREGFHALYALARFRGSERAREVAEASIATINRLWDPDRRLGGGSNRPGARRQLSPPGDVHYGAGPGHRPAGQVLPGDGFGTGAGAGDGAKGKGRRGVLSRRRELRHGTLRRAHALDDVRDVVAGAAGRPADRRAADGAGPFVLRARSPGNPRRTRVGDREQCAGRSAGSRRGQQHGRHPGNRADPGSLGLHRGLRRRRADSAGPLAAQPVARHLVDRGAGKSKPARTGAAT